MTRTGFFAIVGRPNVGKSTLLNALTGEKVAITSAKPQTTRNRITGILTQGDDQYVFLDTPGLHKPRTKLGDYMVKSVSGAIGDVDCAILVVEPNAKISPTEEQLLARFRRDGLPAILVINKTDRANGDLVGRTIALYAERFSFAAVVPVSALREEGVADVLSEASHFLAESEFIFPPDQFTDQPERQIAAEIIREKILRTMEDEIPHGTAVVIESFEEKRGVLVIRAEIYCERATHKGMLIGKQGEQLKRIGTYAREDMEAFFGCRVHLDLWVRVRENWRDSTVSVSNFGYKKED